MFSLKHRQAAGGQLHGLACSQKMVAVIAGLGDPQTAASHMQSGGLGEGEGKQIVGRQADLVGAVCGGHGVPFVAVNGIQCLQTAVVAKAAGVHKRGLYRSAFALLCW
jgi:hypothetical protein